MLNKAIAAVEDSNDALAGVLKNNIDFNAVKGKTKIQDQKWKDLLDHFNQPGFVLVNDNFEFPDLLGAAYEYLIKYFADSAGKKGGEFYTPAEVVRLLVQITKPQAGNEVYDPTAGSGGFLIQAHQYVEEQGEDPNDLALFGQDSNGTVWSICNMNVILHNITRFIIENGDTLEDPLILHNGQVRKFDRVLANPPFSQNYSRANMNFTNRFREWTPETGKKADLMFVQHMLASLKPRGYMATIMPHGVLFRGGKEKLIREMLIKDDVIEAIVSLPPELFYGTGIQACVLVCNRNKPEELRNKILFVNADREYAEGKNQNKLRPEDIEKIEFVVTHKRELPNYSRLVDVSEIATDNDYNLNIRLYVDNTPAPEQEDVRAHLIGGIPEDEVARLTGLFKSFGVGTDSLFEQERPGYLAFRPDYATKARIKLALDFDPAVQKTVASHHEALEAWWSVARDDFAQLRDGKRMPEVRQELMRTLKTELVPLEVLDEFKSAGVFVNWWQQIRYDLKTIVSTGWHHSLIPDAYLISEFFRTEAEAIDVLETAIAEAAVELVEVVEIAQEEVAYEAGEDEEVTAATIKIVLNDLITDLKLSSAESAKKDLARLKEIESSIKSIEKRITDAKREIRAKTDEVDFKLQVKRLGGDAFKQESVQLVENIDARLTELDPKESANTRRINALKKDREILHARILKTDALVAEVGGMLSEEESRRLILGKIYDIARDELQRYVDAERRALVLAVENLWDKYAVSNTEIEASREVALATVTTFLGGLGYLGASG